MIPAAMVHTLSKRLIKVNAEKLYFRGIMCVCVCVGERGSTIRSTFSWVPLNLNKWPHFKLSTREREREE